MNIQVTTCCDQAAVYSDLIFSQIETMSSLCEVHPPPPPARVTHLLHAVAAEHVRVEGHLSQHGCGLQKWEVLICHHS